ncbi:MAG TPA: class I SAM-dependent methyltransferase [Streptosporangiaceae bacterium]
MESGSDWPADWTGRSAIPISVDEAFNGYVAAQIVFALDRLGLLDELLEHGQADVRVAADRTGADERMLGELLRGAQTCGYVVLRDGVATITPAGRDMAFMRGYFIWAVGGYSDLFSNIAGIVSGDRRFGSDIFRDEAMVALGSGSNDRAFMASTVDEVVGQLDFTVIADLGSGISARVCRVAAAREGARGVGLDISGDATRLGQDAIRRAGLDKDVQAVQADVLGVIKGTEKYPVLAEVDAVMSFFLLHDLLADADTRPRVIPGLREAFPKARTFVLADTMLRPAQPDDATLPVFSAGYELAHALMGVPLHTKDTYEALFAQAGLRTRQVLPFGTPHSWLYVLDAD